MNTIWIIFKKEIKELFRDRKSLFMMIGFPILILPILLAGGLELVKKFSEKEAEKNIKIAFVNIEQDKGLKNFISEQKKYQIIENINLNDIVSLIESDSLDIILEYDKKFAQNLESNSTGIITLHHKTKGLKEMHVNFTNEIINQYEENILVERLKEKEIEEKMLNPIDLTKNDITSEREKVGKSIGGLIPYFILIYCFIGAMMAAIELGASEKEKGTLETLLASPSSHFKILLGKWCAVFLTSFSSAFAVVLGLILTINIVDIPKDIYSVLFSLLSINTIILIMLVITPIAGIFSAITLSISIYSKSFKEAQNYISPMMMIIILPAILGMTLPLDLNSTSALIPIYNVVLSCKEIMAGTIETSLLLEVLISSFSLSIIAIFFSSKLFKKESFIFRN
jgi:sodium transport system permease protein